ncbi:chorismate synthase [Shigella flexneri]
MAGNTIGQLFRVTTFGESHGLALGCIVDGVPPGIPLTEADLQHDLDRRRPGTSRYTTQRREPDQVEILSGVFEGVTTGTSIGSSIEIPTSVLRITAQLKTSSVQAMPITPTNKNTVLRDYRGGGRFRPRNRHARGGRGDCQRISRREIRIEIRGCLTQMGDISAGNQRLVAG